ncbi:MAG: hypothetical protein ACK5IN_09390 [Microbacterium sp.]|uniref:hypothetical protein n=1 Tax=Microbacterium sp. TaxID=51671 RepID=UPI003A8AC7FC
MEQRQAEALDELAAIHSSFGSVRDLESPVCDAATATAGTHSAELATLNVRRFPMFADPTPPFALQRCPH